jgi:acyl-CoA synthetase (NDP forming)
MITSRKKPIVLHSLYSSEKPHSLDLLRYYGIPVYDSLDISCKCISVLASYGTYLRGYRAKTNFVFNWGEKAKKEGLSLIQQAKDDGRNVLLEHEAKTLLRLHGAKIPKDFIVKTAQEAVDKARELQGRKVLKIVSPDILHKSDAGGVALGLKTDQEIRTAFNRIMKSARAYNPEADIRGLLLSSMANKGVETIIGTKMDDQFGPVIMYGLGGIMVEILKDVSFRVLPLSRRSAKNMIKETQSAPILEGIRGDRPYDSKAIINLLLLCSELIESYPDILEMDLNPVIVHHEGCSIADARILLK